MSCVSCSSPPLSIGANTPTNAAFGNCPFNPDILKDTTVAIIAPVLGPGFMATVNLTIPFTAGPQTISVQINQSRIVSATNITDVITGAYTVFSKIVIVNTEDQLNLYLVPRTDPQPANLTPYPYYSFFLFYDGSVVNIKATYHSCGTTISTPPPPPQTTSSLHATAYLTPDGQNLCQVEIETTEERCDRIIISIYKQYCVAIQDVICAKGCTLAQKVDNLGLDLNDFVSNALLRYTLSKLLFGCFDLNYLRQRYYQRFLARLGSKDSQWRFFLPYFNNNYWTFFKK